MALKTFNLDSEVYKQFSKHCKENGISMSKKIENFIKQELSKLKTPKTIKPTENHIRKYVD
jgi:macrodomain Ter protein organizer (MatP/YcbG family)